MAVVIRLSRGGTKKKPFFYVVAADKQRPRDGKYLANLGIYNPKAKPEARLTIDRDAVAAWVKKGAKVTETVGHLLKAAPKSK